MIVENIAQIQKYEEWKIFNGKYYKIPQLFTKKFERININLDFSFLIEYIENFDEIILALSPTPEGIMSANFIFDTIKKEKPKTNISKLAIGVPIGSHLDYMDQLTMSYAIKNRKDIK